MGDLADHLAGWIGRVGDEFGRVSLSTLLVVLALQTLQTVLNALAWRNILQAAYPSAQVRFRSVFGAYAGGVGLNDVLPAQGGTITMVGLYRAGIPGSTLPGLVGACFVQTLFFAVVSAVVYALLFVTRPGAAEVQFGGVRGHLWVAAAVSVGVIAIGAAVARLLWRRLRRALSNAKEGAAILGTPGRYVTRVLAPQLGSYGVRIGVTATLMSAYGVPVSLRSVFLIIGATSIATMLALTPGGIGTQQALSSVALRDVASSATVTAYSLGQQVILTAWNLALAAVALSATIGWRVTRAVVHDGWVDGRAAAARERFERRGRRHGGAPIE